MIFVHLQSFIFGGESGGKVNQVYAYSYKFIYWRRLIMSSEMTNKSEEMVEFFNLRVDGYDDHMKNNVVNYDEFYGYVSQPIIMTGDEIEILDLGCGTGLEFEGVLKKAPNARLTGIDMCEKMLQKAREKYEGRMENISLICGSYLDINLGELKYDYVLSVMTLHHLLHNEKYRLYQSIRKSLKPGGKYIEGDYIATTLEEEEQYLKEYDDRMNQIENAGSSLYHIDIPFTIETQVKLLYKAGFARVEVLWNSDSAAVLTAYK